MSPGGCAARVAVLTPALRSQTLETRASFEGASERDTGASLMNQAHMSEGELFVKDAFLVFRALCKLSMKPLGSDRCALLAGTTPRGWLTPCLQ